MRQPLFISFALVLAFALVGCATSKDSQQNNEADRSPNSLENENGPDPHPFLLQVIQAAKKGKVPSTDFIAGQSNISEINKAWGEPDQENKTSQGIYREYKDKGVAFGYYRHAPIFDVRSYNTQLQHITLSDIKKQMGNPDDIHYYKDDQVNQQILVYALNESYELKWVLPKPSESNPNPRVDHLSVYDQHVAEHSIPAEINNMTLDEKLGQMIMVGVDGTNIGANEKMFIKDKHIGGLILYGKNISTVSQTISLINQLKATNKQAGNPLPLFISVDQEGGSVERMPSAIKSLPSNAEIGAVNKTSYSKEIGQLIGTELKEFGFNMDFAPVLDIRQSSRAAIGNRSFSSDKNVVSRLGLATMKGIQSKQVISVIKHFPGYGSVTVDAHKDLPEIHYGLQTLEKVDWVPYKQAIKQGADTVMVTHLMVPKLNAKYPASMSHVLITDMLREKLDFNGVVITDDMTMGAIEKHYSIDQAAVISVKAGADIVLVAFNKNEQLSVLQALKNAVHSGDISMDRIDDSAYRIIKIKRKYELSNEPADGVNVNHLNQMIKEARDGSLASF